LSEQAAERLRKGVTLNDGPTQPALIRIGEVAPKRLSPREQLRIQEDETFSPWQTTVWCTITEGRKRQVRRMFAHIGHPVLTLEREALGSLELGSLPPSQWRPLTPEELEALREASGWYGS
ncbi:MAG: rRNA pseudouridine synthase, partial [Coriobacteriales bacterium]|nr:rRNA pseudouridine synthase [Coriobacteriales bacterium]